MAAGLAITVAGLGMTVLLLRAGSLPSALVGRLQLLALSALVPTATLAVSIARLAAHRFRTPQDFDGSGLTSGTDRAKLLQALLQNTLEQVVLALPVYAAWGMLAPARLLPVMCVAAVLFLFGRVLFFRGYAGGASSRALGFALTFYPTVVLLVSALIFFLRSNGT
jgi:uncharacterized membrane protein YecN with MAPEG domain